MLGKDRILGSSGDPVAEIHISNAIGFLTLLLFMRNSLLAWAALSEKVEGPQRGGHSPALLAPAQTTCGDYLPGLALRPGPLRKG